MKFLNRVFLLGTALAVGLSFTSCSDDDDDVIPEGIVVTINPITNPLDTVNNKTITGTITSSEKLESVAFYFDEIDDDNNLITKIEKDLPKNKYNFNLDLSKHAAKFKELVGDKESAKFIVFVTNKKTTKSGSADVKIYSNNLEKAVEFTLGNPQNNPSKNPKVAYGVTYDQDGSKEATLKGSFAVLTKDAFDKLTSKSAIKKAFDDATKATSVKLAHDNKTQVYLVTLDKGEYYLIESTKVDVSKDGDHFIKFSMRK